MRLRDALRLNLNSKLALTGAGGKTSALFLLAQEFLGRVGSRPDACINPTSKDIVAQILIAATTHMSLDQTRLADHHITLTNNSPLQTIDFQRLEGSILFTGMPDDRDRVSGISLAAADSLLEVSKQLAVPLLIEADGSRQRPLKAPATHEPVVPAWVDAVAVIVGLSGIGRPCTSDWVFREERFAGLAGIALGDVISVDQIARVLNHPSGGLWGIPESAEKIALLTQLSSDLLQSEARRLAQNLIPLYHSAVLADLATATNTVQISEESKIFTVHEQTAGIILAAGASSRFGGFKQVLEFRGKPLVRYAAEAALAAGLLPVVVVTGNQTEQVRKALEGLPLNFSHNPDWESGQSSSIRAGLQALDPAVGAAIFLLADQPLVTPDLLQALIAHHSASLAPIVAPLVDGQRANPVLFDRFLFAALSALQGDSGGRQLFSRCRPTWIPWLDRSILIDVDSPEDLDALNHSYGTGAAA